MSLSFNLDLRDNPSKLMEIRKFILGACPRDTPTELLPFNRSGSGYCSQLHRTDKDENSIPQQIISLSHWTSSFDGIKSMRCCATDADINGEEKRRRLIMHFLKTEQQQEEYITNRRKSSCQGIPSNKKRIVLDFNALLSLCVV
uniref:Uncharacterized protein n=1 Tax=Glossina austeni TaxID=7395 RepID=A0A1A9UZJ0_GLOAU